MDHKDSYDERQSQPNIAENECELFFPNIVRFGFDEKNANIKKELFVGIPPTIRNAPDFIVFSKRKGPVFMDAKGFTDTIKIKLSDIKAYSFWNHQMPLYFFFLDCEESKHSVCSFMKLIEIIEDNDVPIETYHDNNKGYYDVPKNLLYGKEVINA